MEKGVKICQLEDGGESLVHRFATIELVKLSREGSAEFPCFFGQKLCTMRIRSLTHRSSVKPSRHERDDASQPVRRIASRAAEN